MLQRDLVTGDVSVRPSVCLSHAVIESKLITVGSCDFHHRVDRDISFYRATRMHSADYAMARCLSVRLSVRPSVCMSVTRRYCV